MIIAARGAARSLRIDYSVAQMADDALQLMDALGYAKVHWCGHSTGGAMGQVLAIEHPDRIDRLVLSATWAKTDAFFRRLFEVRSMMLRELGPVAYMKGNALALQLPSWIRDHDDDLAAPEAKATRRSRSRRSSCRASRHSGPRPARPAAEGAGAHAAICTRDDIVTPLYFTEELVRLIPHARAYVLPDGGHFYPHVHGGEFRRVMTSFLLES